MGPLNHIEPTRFSGGLPVHYCYWCRVCCLLIFIGVIFLTTVTLDCFSFIFTGRNTEHRGQMYQKWRWGWRGVGLVLLFKCIILISVLIFSRGKSISKFSSHKHENLKRLKNSQKNLSQKHLRVICSSDIFA